MYNKLFVLFFILSSLIRSDPKNLTTSLIIPCHYKHVKYLDDLLRCYELQTILPDEVVVSISEFDKASQVQIDKLMNTKFLFPVRYLLSKEQAYAGVNRNNACQIAKGDIFVMQDADDLPTSRRIEVIKYFFEKHNVDHLIHLFNFMHDRSLFKLEDIEYLYPKSYSDAWNKVKKFHNGNIAIKRHVFEQIKWTNKQKGQDVEFNEKVYSCFKCIIVLKVLNIYRVELSSWKRYMLFE